MADGHSEQTFAVSTRERFIENAHYGNGTGCRCCDLIDEGILDRLLTALEWISDPSYVGNYSEAEVVEIHRKWARNALGREL